MGKQSSNRKIAEEVIRFLDKHMLDPTPANYAFAFLYITESNGLLRKLVNDITDGGVRLTQGEVDDMMTNTADGAADDTAAIPSDAMDDIQKQLRHQALTFTELTTAALSDASTFNRDLAEGMEQIAAGFDFAGVISAMRQKTAEVERKLAETKKETEKLRLDLDAARNDASRDALTSLSNRRAMDEKIEEAFRKSARITIAFCDIDHFKSVNDRFGHAVGDRVLKAVADILQTGLAPYPVARFGGEEFVALFPDMAEAEAFGLIEQARVTVSEKFFRLRDTDAPLGQVTFSAGIASTTSNPEQALQDADKALYEAKSSGRNRTIIAS
ncbi:GGDEF domain-containing protein [Sphingobium phenoxybenzoativorans]|uniref:diguanylate cyclase n=1 Tax=Sphingobium phenoxybenzoativorans TaxID=1592790 RepID=A0A975K709_9SPHN|nr:GGDEF domain-containing protein [Sphingobium phenoxybenzoativorans]QUT05978.1 GGDEF domain-containing protein [Sphingobium phenoxybenzoativorans]